MTNNPDYPALPEIIAGYTNTLAAYITDQLAKNTFDSPLKALQLRYDTGYFSPFVRYTTLNQWTAAAADSESPFSVAVDYDVYKCMHMREDVSMILAQLYERGKSPVTNIGVAVMEAVALQLTRSRMLGRIKVTDDFIAFAFDPALSPAEPAMESLLLRCGAPATSVQNWKDQGWLPTI